jgi:DNA-binding NarL/FixJ family response regulator
MPVDGRARVLIADDHEAVLDRAVKTLAIEFSVVGAVGNGERLVAAEAELHPDAIVVDVCMPGMSGLEAVAHLRRRGCQAAMVCLTANDEPEIVEAAWEAGALGFVVKPSLATDLVPAVRAALEGRRFLSAPTGAVR